MASRHEFRRLVFEGLMVAFSVLAALLVDEWRQGVQERHNVAAAAASIDHEIRDNLRELETLDSVASARLARLRALDPTDYPGKSLGELASRFGGYRTPVLASAAWERMSMGSLADHVPADYMTDAFGVYQWITLFEGLDDQVQRLVYSETFHDPRRTAIAQAISVQIMEQEITWARQAGARLEKFLEEHSTPFRRRR